MKGEPQALIVIRALLCQRAYTAQELASETGYSIHTVLGMLGILEPQKRVFRKTQGMGRPPATFWLDPEDSQR